jgi:hypothetical protein
MKRINKLTVGFCFLAALFSLSQAQLKSQLPSTPSIEQSIRIPGLSSALGSLNLFDPSRFSMSHSYSLSFISGGGMSTSLGMYQNTMRYLLTDKLLLTTHLGFIHNPLQGNALTGKNLTNNLIYGADLLYHPTNNLWLNFSFSQAPASSRFYYPYYYRYLPEYSE